MTSTKAPGNLVLEKELSKYNKKVQAEFEENKFIRATVDGEELVPSKFKSRISNVLINDPTVQVSEDAACSITILDSQGTWMFSYPPAAR